MLPAKVYDLFIFTKGRKESKSRTLLPEPSRFRYLCLLFLFTDDVILVLLGLLDPLLHDLQCTVFEVARFSNHRKVEKLKPSEHLCWSVRRHWVQLAVFTTDTECAACLSVLVELETSPVNVQ